MAELSHPASQAAADRPLTLFFSTRALEMGASGGIVGYMLGLAGELAKQPGFRVHAGIATSAAGDALGRALPGAVATHAVEAGAAGREHERAVAGEVGADWIVACYPADADMPQQSAHPCRLATCIPDLQHLVHPRFFNPLERCIRDLVFRTAVEASDLVFTLSGHSKHQIEQVYGCAEVAVVPAAAANLFLEGVASVEMQERLRSMHGLQADYAVFPANFWPHKNHARLIEAFVRVRRRGVDAHLVLCGRQDHAGDALKELIETSRRQGWLHPVGYLSDEELHALMSGARCLVFPSLFEGFGIPVAEALALGLPVACSEGSSLPEVGGDVADYFDPLDNESIAQGVMAAWEKGASKPLDSATARGARFTYAASADRMAASLRQVSRPECGPAASVHAPAPLDITVVVLQADGVMVSSLLSPEHAQIEGLVMPGGGGVSLVGELLAAGRQARLLPEGGRVAVLNAAFADARGSLLCLLGEGVSPCVGAFARVAATFARMPSLDVLLALPGQSDGGPPCDGWPMHGDSLRWLRSGLFPGGAMACWRRKAFIELGPFSPGLARIPLYDGVQRAAAKGALLVAQSGLVAISAGTVHSREMRADVREVLASQWRNWGEIPAAWWEHWLLLLPAVRRFPISRRMTRFLAAGLSKAVRRAGPRGF